ncbi:hypothetical protein [Acetobacteroides hydrogenigenes]|uniref:N-acetyltransferase domain-containing protein n=1 Tax=Acetobacteroides hydrogenigenes TaxID=979970 RepID=A0A4R2E3D6_9BACT|nr:hypothetical protein [Acetobacteroides hydrogenigenes]TCN62203.1 hypothetical protein CLV25_11936 [Acetobacteroides hydrogenigenes]
MMFKLRVIFEYFFNKIYSNDELLVYKYVRSDSLELLDEITIEKVSDKNIKELALFEDKEKIDWLNSKILKGNDGYIAFYNGICCHRSWVLFGPYNEDIHFSYKLDLKSNECLIHYCETNPKFRGLGIYPYVLKYICNKYPDLDKIIVVNKKNIPSIKGIEKACFILQYSFKIKTILFFSKIIKNEDIVTC